MISAPLAALQERLGYHFHKPSLLAEALRHRSACRETGRKRSTKKSAPRFSNERLEFLGDRVLGLLMAEWLESLYPDEPEGRLGARLAQLASGSALERVARELRLSEALEIAPEEEQAGVRERASVNADGMEALLGAVYLDGGLEPARLIVRRLWEKPVLAGGAPPKGPKTLLQEYALGQTRILPAYRLLDSHGPDHAPVFTVLASAMGQSAEGKGASKQAAENDAAGKLLNQLQKKASV